MAQIRNKFEIQDSINEELSLKKRLPNFFDEQDEISPLSGLLLSVLSHIVFVCFSLLLFFIHGIIFPHLPKPELAKQNIEFKLVQNESKPPINKNTKIRSDRDSQAGGKHDPKKPIAEPSPKPAAPSKPAVAQKPKVQQKPVVKQPQKPVVKQQPQPKQKVVQAPKKPTPITAPSVKPSVKPQSKPTGVAKPSAPKIATAPKSPFTVSAPTSKAPVGNTYKPQGVPSSSSASGKSSGAPSPKFSTSGASSGSSGASGSSGRYASRGSSGGYGSSGNPSPGNPNGAPGIDAIRQPNWGPYMRDLEQRIKRNWNPPKGDSSKRVVITFEIGRDGRLISHRVTKTSGSPLADRAAMSAIELTAPFRPLPPEYRGNSVPIEFTFDYNVLNSVIR
ncbi:MAG: TonB family protein [Candidatus Gastranaerophilales bacterium]|nr:TonB family protein [Candidatus Gastranaerophilales bacterium]